MPSRTGQDCITGLKKRPREVWIDGELERCDGRPRSPAGSLEPWPVLAPRDRHRPALPCRRGP